MTPVAPASELRPVARWPASRRRLIAALLIAFGLALIVWLIRPSASGAFAVAAETGVLTIEPLCPDKLVWDLPPGRVALRSAVPGTNDVREGRVTLTLLPGSRVRLESTAPGLVVISVSHTEARQAACATDGRPFYEISVDDQLLTNDPVGVIYGPSPAESAVARPEHSALEIRGRVTLGDVVQTGAGWNARVSGLLESGTVDLRVVPWLSQDRVTLRTEKLEKGSLFDTHACLGDATQGSLCPASNAPSAIGFLRTLGSGGLSVQLYSTGSVGTQSFGGKQYVLGIPQAASVWESPVLKAILSVILGMFTLYQGTKAVLRDSIGWWRGKPLGMALILSLGAGAASAEPVEVRQGTLVGAGYSFRRGGSCFVVTARHVVPQPGTPVSVLDRSGAKVEASRAYDNDSYDLALLSLPDRSPVACTSTWPDAGWLTRASFNARNEFRAIRHYPNGRETIVRLQHAGGIKHLLTLAPLDRLTVRESDSGAIVELDDRLVGIVQSVDSASDRVNVLRFDTIDSLIGDRFRGTALGPVRLSAVVQRGRPNPQFTTYVQSWLTEKAGRAVLPATGGGRQGASACEITIDVVAWDRVQVDNPAYGNVELQLKACGQRNFLSQQICSAGRAAQRTTPRRVLSNSLTINTTVTPPDGPPLSKLETTSHVPPSNPPLARTELELWTIQSAVGPTLQDLMSRAPCR